MNKRAVDIMLEAILAKPESAPLRADLEAVRKRLADMGSKGSVAQAEVEEQFETALQKFFQIRLTPYDDRDHNHWRSGLNASLNQAEKANENPKLRRGYWFDRDKLIEFLREVDYNAFNLAAGHLGLSGATSSFPYSIEELYNEVGRSIPVYWR